MSDMRELESSIITLSDTALSIQYKIHANPSGVLDNLLHQIQKVVETIREKLSEKLDNALADIRSIVQILPDSISRAIGSVAEILSEITGSITNRFHEILSDIQSSYSGTIANIISFISITLNGIMEKLGALINNVKEGIAGVVGNISDFANTVKESMVTGLTTVGRNIVEGVKELLAGITEKIRNITETVSLTFQEVTEKVSSALRVVLEHIQAIAEELLKLVFRLANWIEKTGYPVLQSVLSDTKDGIMQRGKALVEVWSGLQHGDTSKIVSGLQTFIRIEKTTDVSSLLFAAAIFSAIVPGVVGACYRPALDLALQAANANNPVRIVDEGELIRAALRQILPEAQYFEMMVRLGYNRETAKMLIESNRPLPSPGMIQEAFLRGYINETQHDALLRKHGYTDENIKLFKALYFVIPSVSDIIRMAVREAFTPEIAKKFGQYEDFPEVFAGWAEKLGLSREWAERYWAAHWDLPSPQMGFEMLHRGVIDENELKLLLRALDVMPYWREKLIAISYAPYTRVDVRRMYQLGILSEDDVYKSYRQLGYDDEKARNLTEFTVRYYTADDKTELDEYRVLSRSIYVSAYKKGIISRDETADYLRALRYSDKDVELILAIADAELAVNEQREDTIPMRTKTINMILDALKRGVYNESETRESLAALQLNDNEIEWYITLSAYELELGVKSTYIQTVKDLYITNEIDKPKAIAMLQKLYPTSRELDSLFELWDFLKEMRTRKLTEAQYRAALMRGIITIDEYAEELRGLGYSEKSVNILVKLAVGR